MYKICAILVASIFVLPTTLQARIARDNSDKPARLKDVTDALQCAAGEAADKIGQKKIPNKFSKLKFTITVKFESTIEKSVNGGLKDGVFTLFPTMSTSWKSTHVQKQTLANKFSFKRNLHEKNTQACNRRSNFDTGVVDSIAEQLQRVVDDPSVIPETNIEAASTVTDTNNSTLAASLGIPFVTINGSYGRTSLRTLEITVVSP